MSNLTNDLIKATVQIGTSEAQKSITDLARATGELKNQNQALRIEQAKLKSAGKENTEEYRKITEAIKANNEVIKENDAQMKELRSNISVTGMSLRQLKKEASDIRRELASMVPGENDSRLNELKDRLKEVESQSTKLSSEIGLTRAGMSQFASSVSSIPGPVGDAVSSISSLIKSLWALVATPVGATIAVIVGALTLLYKAFTSTDSGAVMLQGTLKAIGNTFDILLDRSMSFFKSIGSLITLDWAGFKKNASDAFLGIGKAVKEVVGAGYDYATTMDDIADREAAAQIRMSKLGAEIETLKNKSKDANLTTKEKIALETEAMNKAIELNGIEKGFLQERTDAETKNLAAKIQNNKLSLSQKEELLKKWLEIDDKQLASAMANDAAFAEFENKNEEAFQALQKQKSEAFNKDKEFQTETTRLQKSLSTDIQSLIAEDEKAKKEAAEKALSALDTAHKSEVLKIKQYYADKEQLDKEYKARMLASELAYLLAKSKLETDESKKLDLQSQIIDKQKEYTAALKEAVPELMKTYDAVSKSNDKLFEQEKLLKKASKAEKDAAKDTEDLKKKQEEMADTISGSIGVLSDGIYEMASGTEDAFKTFAKNLLNFALEQLKYQAELAIAGVTIQGLASLNPAAMLVAAGKIAVIEATFAAIEGLINGAFSSSSSSKSYSDGGYTGPGGKYEPAGIVHKKEYVIPEDGTDNPNVRSFIDIIEIARRNGSLARLDLRPVMMSVQSGKSFASGGATSQTNAGSGQITIEQTIGISADDVRNFTAAINKLMKWEPSIVYETIEKKKKIYDSIVNGGLK